MSMSKKDFIALADVIISVRGNSNQFHHSHIEKLADFCQSQNPNFKRERWLGYIKGECGPNGGDVKPHKSADGTAPVGVRLAK